MEGTFNVQSVALLVWSLRHLLREESANRATTNTASSVILGALVGAIFAFLATQLHGWLEMRARRATLFRMLEEQLNSIVYTPAGIRQGRLVQWPAVHVSAVAQLLEGAMLDARKDAELIRLLLQWQPLESNLNEAIHLAQLASVLPGVWTVHQDDANTNVRQSHNAMREWRGRILRVLPPVRRRSRYIPNLEDEYLELGKEYTTSIFSLSRLQRLWRRSPISWDQEFQRILEWEEKSHCSRLKRLDELFDAEKISRQKMRAKLERMILPALDLLTKRLNPHRHFLKYQRLDDKDYDPQNPQLSEFQITSSSAVYIGITPPEYQEIELFIIMSSAPNSASVRIAGKDPRLMRDYRGWSEQIPGPIESLTEDALLSALMRGYARQFKHARELERDQYPR